MAVWAHPWIGDTKNNFKMIKRYVKAGLKGIEINNGKIEFWINDPGAGGYGMAKKYPLNDIVKHIVSYPSRKLMLPIYSISRKDNVESDGA